MGCLKEAFCWGCSIAEVNREIVQRKQEGPLEGNSLLGWVHAPNSM